MLPIDYKIVKTADFLARQDFLIKIWPFEFLDQDFGPYVKKVAHSWSSILTVTFINKLQNIKY